MIMIFVPVSRAVVQELNATGELAELAGFTASAALRRAVEAADDETADYTAFGYAGVAAIGLAGETGQRLVLAGDLDPVDVTGADGDDPFGRVTVTRLRWRDATAVFVDEVAARPAVRSAQAVSQGRDLAELLKLPEVEALQADHDLLWHLPAEVAD